MPTRGKTYTKAMRCPFCGRWFRGTHTKANCPAKIGEIKNYKIKHGRYVRKKKRGFFKKKTVSDSDRINKQL